MIKSMQSTSTQNRARFGSSALYFFAIVLLFLSGLFLWLNNLELPTDKRIFYWSLGLNLIYWGSCLTVPLALACAFFWVKSYGEQIVNWEALTSLVIFIALFLALAWTHYIFAWGGSSHVNIGTENFAGNTYDLVTKEQFDETTRYYLGVCTSAGFQCEFHVILWAISSYDPNNISMEATQGALLVKADGEVVYKYDGVQESCTDTEWVICPLNNQ